MRSNAGKFGLRENLATLFRHQRLILGVALLSGAVSFAVAMAQSKVWDSAARIVVQQNRQSVRVGAGSAAADLPFGLNRSEQVRTEIEIFSSPAVMAEAVTRLGPEQVLARMRWRWDGLRELPERLIDPLRRWVLQVVFGQPAGRAPSLVQQAMRKAAAHLVVEPVRETAVFGISFESPDAQFSALMVNTLIDVYLSRHIAVRQVAATSGVFAAETQRLRAELQAAVLQQQSLKADAGVVSVGPQKQLLLQRLSDAEAALARSEIEAVESSRRIAEAERQLARRAPEVELQTTVSRNPMVDTLRQQLAQLEVEGASFQPGSAAARSTELEIASLRKRMGQEQDAVKSSRVSGADTTYRELERSLLAERSRLSALSSRADLKRQIVADQAELARLDHLEDQLREGNREVDLKEEALRASLRKEEEERLGSVMNEHRVSDVVPIERATEADRPLRPRVSLVTAIGLATGLLAGLVLAFLTEYFRRTITTREEATDQLGAPVLASLLDTRRAAAAATVNQIELRRIAEALRHERSHDGAGLAVLVTSTSVGEGKSTLVQQLVDLLGRHDNACAVLDASGSALSLPGTAAPVDLTRSDAPTIAAVRSALQTLRDSHPLVLVDGPALGSSGHGLWLPELVDRVLLVVQAEFTTGVNATRTLRIIEAAGGALMGVVLNRRRLFIPNWVYGWLLSPRHAMQP